ncbi:hypothetical protein IAT38_007259 [Cryptococcus sp. DSM 104549]
MPFSTRNAFYLRVSNYRVIPLFLYLDERHVDWMTDPVLQLVIASLQPKMAELLYNAKNEKKHKVHVERGEGYQFCYFLRSTTRTEVVLLKKKKFSLRPPTPPRVIPDTPTNSKRKRSGSTASTSSSRAQSKAPRRSRTRSRSVSARPEEPEEGGGEVGGEEEGGGEAGDGLVAMDDEDEDESAGMPNIKDWKPDVDVSYRSFGTSSVQLVLIIEPHPPLPPSQYAPPSSRLSSRSASIASSYSRARSAQGTNALRYSSTSLSVAPLNPGGGGGRGEGSVRNMRNASRAASALPAAGSSRRGGSSVSATPYAESSTPGPGARGQRTQTPLFFARDTPFDGDEEDEEAHEAYEEALRVGRLRLPSVRPGGGEGGENDGRGQYDWEAEEDVPESVVEIGERLVRNSEIEKGVVRVQGGWEERGEGEESAVMGREEPGE